MTEILGHDIDGNPLRAGDRVVVVSNAVVQSEYIGKTGMVTARYMSALRIDGVIDLDNGDNWIALHGGSLRKLPPKTDHEPADEEFTEWLKGMNVGLPA